MATLHDKFRMTLWRPILFLVVYAAAMSIAVSGEPLSLEAGPKPVEEMNIEELRAYQAFYFLEGGRDPMTMRLPEASETGEITKGKGPTKIPTIEEMEQFLTKALADIEIAFKIQDYEEAIQVSAAAMKTVDEEWPPLKADPPQLRRMDEQIRAYHRLAVRLKMQEEIKKEFAGLDILVEGVAWSPIGSKAIVNGKTFDAGEPILQIRKEGDLRVEAIEEHGVVFQFKGMRFRKDVQVFSESEIGSGVKK